MLCSAAPEKVSALNLKRLKADNKTCGQSQKSHPKGWLFFLARAIGTAYLTMAAVPYTMAENTAREGYHGILEDERGRQ